MNQSVSLLSQLVYSSLRAWRAGGSGQTDRQRQRDGEGGKRQTDRQIEASQGKTKGDNETLRARLYEVSGVTALSSANLRTLQ